ncbi:flagellar basal-body rod protein FlgG, partial [Vibrio parahaemolyticus V-223/04]
KPPT